MPQPHMSTEIDTQTGSHTHPKPTYEWTGTKTRKHTHTHTGHETNSGKERDKQHKPEEGSDCFRHMWQESTRRITERGKNGEADSLTGMLDNQTDAQMGKMTDKQAGRLIFCYASPCCLTLI